MPKGKKRTARRKSNLEWWIRGAIALIAVSVILWRGLANQASSSSPALSTLTTQDYHSLAFHPTNPDILFFGYHGGMMQSGDGGKRWSSLSSIQQDAMSIAIGRSGANVITIAGHNVLSQSNDGGKTWHALATNLPGNDIHAFTVNPNNPQEFYAFVAGFGLYKSEDNGAMWGLLNNAVPASTTGLALQADAPQTIYLGSGQQGLFKSTDGGKTWTPIPTSAFQAAISLAFNDKGELFVATNQGVFKGVNGGGTWTRLSVDTGAALALAISPSNPQRIAVVNDKGQFFRSDDGGITWGK